MSEQLNKLAAALPNPQEANRVFQQIETEAFFHKLAELGHRPRNEKEAASMLHTAALAMKIKQLPAVKEAEAKNSPYLQLEEGITKLAARMGLQDEAAAPQSDIDQLALGLTSNPEVYSAAVSLGLAGRE